MHVNKDAEKTEMFNTYLCSICRKKEEVEFYCIMIVK